MDAPTQPGGSRRLALFDLDQTLIPFDTQALFCNYVLHRERWRTLLILFVFLPLVPLRLIGIIDTRRIKRAFLAYLWRLPEDRLRQIADDFAREEFLPRAYPEVAAEMKRLQAEGALAVLNTASPEFYAEPIARALGFDRCVGTRVVVEKAMPLIPKIEGMNNKRAEKLRRMADLLPAGAADDPQPIAGCAAFSDSHADLPMLRLAERGVMIHPTAELAAEGAEKGWETKRPPRPYRSKLGFIAACGLQAFGLYPLVR